MTQALSIFSGLANANPQEVMSCLTAFGQQLAQSRIMGIQTPGDGLVVAVTCAAEGITPLEFARTYHIIEGRPSMKADAMLAKFKAAGGKVKWLDLGDTEQKAEAEFTYAGDTVSMAFTAEQAKKMVGDRFDKKDGNWFKLRPQMLRARLITTALRVIAPELVVGIYTPEEIEEFAAPAKPTAEQVAAKRESYAAMANEQPVVVTSTTTVVEQAPVVVVEQAPAVVTTVTQAPPAEEVPFDATPEVVVEAVVGGFPTLGDTEPVPPHYTKELVTILVKSFNQTEASAEKYLQDKLKCPDLAKLTYHTWYKTREMLIAKAPK